MVPSRVQPGQQQRGLHLRTRDRQLVLDAFEAGAAVNLDRRLAIGGRSMRAPIVRSGAATRSIGRCCSDASPVSSLSNAWPASKPVSSRMPVPELPRSSTREAARRPAEPHPVHANRLQRILVYRHAERFERAARREAVLAVEKAVDQRGAFGDRAEHQRSMRDRLVAGNGDGAADAFDRLDAVLVGVFAHGFRALEHGLRVSAEDFEQRGVGFDLFERAADGLVLGVAVEIDEEHVVPLAACATGATRCA